MVQVNKIFNMANFFYLKNSKQENGKTFYSVSAILSIKEIINDKLFYTEVTLLENISLCVSETADEILRIINENSNVVELTEFEGEIFQFSVSS